MSIKFEVDTSRMERILRNLPGKEEDNNRAIAFRVEGIAKTKAAVDTGAMVNSLYTVCGREDGYAAAANAAKSANPDAETAPLPTPRGTDAHVGPAVEYGVYQEFGTRYMAAHPFLGPAVREVTGELARQWENIAD